ncbi:conserved Plasmodium protein, unknown function [Plasmodium knowlesi strain H]|uniref:HRDC domain-containing protein n=3 Tax=Plasmodium knowlesi TaxID=5850 RepID=A0A1A7VKT9_PLAKH|nr:conserved Plasmodium protein, unknown function [Plasmodium knowlesi strain H]OTN67810.1 Uncharacterized protein PKNOH_S05384800 [Plasmodium knowlesi]CAA9990435.1 conserved Plasmodium protein, unknown function [Plasmodium knowlesi strain H]SBO19641.1 conserved Plasmodium protein, unknown function [Plasmodium knowlesi strain H]SBO22551.1 conserved Plasmodium protein, unknown function [Plasmodium knowlesi strain H]VVS79909.1 conserved Plasmodium protein, unknown function [Plasmodium knowlesi s
MKRGKVINNLHKQIKSLEDNNIPYKYYSAPNNVNIKNYLNDKKVRCSCPPNSYLSLNELLKFVDTLDHHDSDEMRHLDYNADAAENQMTNGKVKKEKYMYDQFSRVPKDALHNKVLVNKGNLCDEPDYHTTVYHQEYRNGDKHANDEIRVNYRYEEHSNMYKHSPDQAYDDNSVRDSNLQNDYCLFSMDDTSSNRSASNMGETDIVSITSPPSYESKCIKRKRKTKVENSSEEPSSSKDGKLLKSLLECRVKLSKCNNITDPEKVISTKNLKLLLLHRPNSIDDIKNLNLIGFGENKIRKYGFEFLNVFLSDSTEET